MSIPSSCSKHLVPSWCLMDICRLREYPVHNTDTPSYVAS